MDDRTKIHTKLNNYNRNIIQSNYDLVAVDTSIDINNITHMELLSYSYNDSASEYALIIQWAVVTIITKQN